MTTLFINRPVFAIVLNAFILLLGVLGYQAMDVSEYPRISVPKIKIGVVYPGASMQVVESTLAFDLEEALSGIQKVESLQSEIGNGYCETWISFKASASIEQALMEVRDRVSRVKASWPRGVLEPYIEQEGKNRSPVLFLTLTSQTHLPAELTHLARLHVKNQLQSVSGVSSIQLNGNPYRMEISLNRAKMAGRKVRISDIFTALQNSQVSFSSGKIQGTLPITVRLELESPEDFETIVVKQTHNEVIYLRDIATVQLREDNQVLNQFNGINSVFLGLSKAEDGNPLSISTEVRALLPSIQKTLPKDVKLDLAYDGSKFVKNSLRSLAFSILEASLLVLLVVFLFLRSASATLIPLVAIPISLLGAIAIAQFFGFSLNTFTLLALVLAIGLVVDDAIIVLENIHRSIEQGFNPKEAAIRGSSEIGFAIIAMTFTLAAVFAPIVLSGGLIGEILVEFGVTLAAAVIVSGIVALTLSPWMCSKLLKAQTSQIFFKLPSLRSFSTQQVSVISALLLMGSGYLYYQLPKRVVPIEDRGFVGVQVESLPTLSLKDFNPYFQQIEAMVQKNPNIENRFLYSNPSWGTGYSFALVEHAHRSESSQTIANQLREAFQKIPSITTHVWNWDTGLPGFEADSKGASISVTIKTTESYQELYQEIEKLRKKLESSSVLKEVTSNLDFNSLGYRAQVDHAKMALLKVSLHEAADTMRVFFDQNENFEFYRDGLRYKVWLKGAEPSDNLHEVEVLNADQERIPLSTFMSLEAQSEPLSLEHTNRLRSATLSAQLQKGKTLSDGIEALQAQFEDSLSPNYSYEFRGAARNWLESSGTFLWLLLFALIFIYGILAIQFESFIDPLVILTTVPLASFGALFTLWLSGQELNLFTQVGLVTLIGLISKHGILLVDFANQTGSIDEAVRLRFRPILMTTSAMVLGAIPLMLSTGAGAEARRSIGTVLVSGLSLGTVLTLYLLPAFYRLWGRSNRNNNLKSTRHSS
ncbi:MAG: efflux RND transporter permease subunit [Myxococcaceae bacterium]|nr:efflux RND transporter permease subunit [Myxococcaceae bacterium]MBH2006749.1 efflux RND transporter permease subunit [Myxococcaceae bacterium]